MKCVWAIFLAFIAATFMFPANTHAIVIGGPVIAISVIKLSAVLVSILAVPLTTLVQLLKKDKKKTFLISLFILFAIFCLVYSGLNVIAPKTQKAPSKAPLEDRLYDKPFYPIKEGVPVPKKFYRPPVMLIQELVALVSFLTLVNFIILSVPTLVVLILVWRGAEKVWTKKRLAAIWFLADLNLAILGAFILALILAGKSGELVLY